MFDNGHRFGFLIPTEINASATNDTAKVKTEIAKHHINDNPASQAMKNQNNTTMKQISSIISYSL
jgi:hypothetical protein